MALKYTKKQLDKLLDGIFNETISEYMLPDDLYLAIADYLKSGLYQGFGKSLSVLETGSADFKLLDELRTNIYAFSGAKTYQEMRSMTELLTDEDGNVRPWHEFRNAAQEVYDEYNVNWLQTERSTAIAQAGNAAQWQQIERNKSTFPLLRYSAVMDENTSDICGPLDGIVLPVDDPFWDEFMPENHFNCRCLVDQLTEDEAPVTTPEELEDIAAGPREKISPMFSANVAKDGLVFNSDHPYFDVPKEDREYAKNNFNLEIPEDDE